MFKGVLDRICDDIRIYSPKISAAKQIRFITCSCKVCYMLVMLPGSCLTCDDSKIQTVFLSSQQIASMLSTQGEREETGKLCRGLFPASISEGHMLVLLMFHWPLVVT